MALLRAVLPTADEQTELLRLRVEFHASQTPSHEGAEEREAVNRLVIAQRKVAEAHGLDPLQSGFGFSRLNDRSWAVTVTYPLTSDEEQRVRGLG